MSGVRSKQRKNGKWEGFFTDYSGKRRFFTGTRSKTDTGRMAAELEDKHRKVRLGLRPPRTLADRRADFPIGEIVGEYLDWGNAQGGRGGRPWGKTHARERKSKLAWWIKRLELETLQDLRGILPRAEKALRDLKALGRDGKGPGLSRKTVANYAEALHCFCRWAKKRHYLDEDPLEDMHGFDTTPESKKRAFTRDEIDRILAVAPEHRRILYKVAVSTGLRARELRSLTPASLDAERKALILDAAWTKNRKPGLQPIPVWLLQELAEFGRSGRAMELYAHHYNRRDARPDGIPEDPLLFVPTHTARDLKKDMREAGVQAFIPGEGKVDFHSFRRTFVTLLIESGANLREAQKLARHASPELTMNLYAKTRPDSISNLSERVGKAVFGSSERVICVSKGHQEEKEDSSNSSDSNELDEGEGWWSRREASPTP